MDAYRSHVDSAEWLDLRGTVEELQGQLKRTQATILRLELHHEQERKRNT